MILCAGEALIDMLPRETGAGETAFAPYPGGAVFNTAIALGRLGEEAGLFTGLSTDLFGAQLEAALEQSGVATDLAVRSDRPTTLAFVTLKDGHAQYAFYDEETAGRMLQPEQLPDLPDSVKAMFFGGISLAVMPCADVYATLCARAGESLPVMIDPNIRPSFIKDEAAYRARIDAMIAVADIVKVSDEDLHWLRGDGALDALAEDLRASGPALVCITKGAEGVDVYSANGKVSIAAEKAEVVDTVGAGDTFNAGLLAGLSQAGVLTKTGLRNVGDADLVRAASLGAKVAAVVVGRAGANPPWAAEL